MDCPNCWGKMQIVPLHDTLPGPVLQESTDNPPGVASLFTPAQIAAGTLLGSTLAGGALLARNFLRSGNRGGAITAMFTGTVLFVVELILLVILSQWFAAVLVRAVAICVHLFQSALFGAYAHDRWKDRLVHDKSNRASGLTSTGWACLAITVTGAVIGLAAYLVAGLYALS